MTTETDPLDFRIRTITKSGLRILIRPIRPDDASLMIDLFKTLSPETIYFRFFMRVKTLSKVMLHFARKSGCSLTWDSDMVAYEMKINL